MNLVITTIVLAPALWFVGRLLIGKDKTKFTNAVWIAALGTITATIFGISNLPIAGIIIQLILWAYLTKRFFNCGWPKALLITIIALTISVMLTVILAVLGYALTTLT